MQDPSRIPAFRLLNFKLLDPGTRVQHTGTWILDPGNILDILGTSLDKVGRYLRNITSARHKKSAAARKTLAGPAWSLLSETRSPAGARKTSAGLIHALFPGMPFRLLDCVPTRILYPAPG